MRAAATERVIRTSQGKSRAPIIAAVAVPTLQRRAAVTVTDEIMMFVDPVLADGVHAVRAIGYCDRSGDMAGSATGERADVSLQPLALNVFVRLNARPFTMG